jgi:hypothetical protein
MMKKVRKLARILSPLAFTLFAFVGSWSSTIARAVGRSIE